jgi:ketosteroid isomerase-like protein
LTTPAVELLLRYYELGNAASAEIDADERIRSDIRAAVARGEAPAMQAMLDMVDEAAEFTASETRDTVFRGHAGQLQLFQQWLDVMSDWRVDAEDFAEGPGGLMLTARVHARGRGSGIAFEDRAYCVARFDRGKVVAFHEFETPQAAREAAGLDPA